MKLARALATVSGFTMLSRILGFIRDILIAQLMGAGIQAEAFFVAFRLPNLFRRLFAEGAFNMAFIPLYSNRLERHGQAAALDFAGNIASLLFLLLASLTIVAQLLMPWIVLGIAAGFANSPEKMDLTVRLSRITFPYLALISFTALISGVLNTHRAFAAAAAAPCLLNVVLIVSLLLAGNQGWLGGEALSWGVITGGIAQLLLVYLSLVRMRLRLRLCLPKISPEAKELLRLSVPGIVAGGATQINIIIGTLVASYFAGAVAWLSYADRIYQLPLGVVGAAVGVALLPDLSRRIAVADLPGARQAFNRSVEFSLIIGIPATVALLIIPGEIVNVIYLRGAFGEEDMRAVSLATSLFAIGLPAFLLVKAYSAIFFANKDTSTPMHCALYAIAMNIFCLLSLSWVIGYLAVPLGTILGAWLNLMLLWFSAQQLKEVSSLDRRLYIRAPKILLASIAMGGFLWFVARQLQTFFDDNLLRYLAMVLLIAGGLMVYAVIGRFLGAFYWNDLQVFRRT